MRWFQTRPLDKRRFFSRVVTVVNVCNVYAIDKAEVKAKLTNVRDSFYSLIMSYQANREEKKIKKLGGTFLWLTRKY